MTCQYQGRRSGEGQLDTGEIGEFAFGHREFSNPVRHPDGNSLALSLSFSDIVVL